MRRFIIGVATLALACAPYTFFPENPTWFKLDASWAANQTGNGANGNAGNGIGGGGAGNAGNGPNGGVGNAGNHGGGGNGGGGNGGGGNGGGGNGGGGTGGGDTGGGGTGGTGGGGTAGGGGGTPAGGGGSTGGHAAGSTAGGVSSASGNTYGGFTRANGVGTIEDLRACTTAPTPGAGLVEFRLKDGGRFSYGGYEFAVPDFVRCMKSKGYKLDTAGTGELTNFGLRPQAARTATVDETDRIMKAESETTYTVMQPGQLLTPPVTQ